MNDSTSDSDRAPAQDPDPERTLTGASAGEASGIIGPYRLLQKIGEGGMGEVWLAEQTQPVRRRVALKVIKAGMDTKQVVARFETERQALALMDHPWIAKIFDAGETTQGRPFFVMEHVAGVPITEHCDRQRLSIRERLALFVQVCEAVQHAHQKAIIHRDLKPSNVLVVMQDGKVVPKIIDFGVAKATSQRLTETTMFTELGALIGTPEYMSPEQAEMTGQHVDTRTDVYALGVILYELLAGALPFDSKALRSGGFEGIARKIREEEPPRPSVRLITLGEQATLSASRRRVDSRTLRSALRGDLDWITMKALEKDPSRRYGSAAELAADVRRHMNDEAVLAGPPSAAYRARKFVKRHRMGVAAASGGVVVLIVFSLTMATQARRIAAEREVSEGVSKFLADMLGNVEPGSLGAALRKDLQEQATELRRSRETQDRQDEEALASLDKLLSTVNATDVALHLLDTQVLARAAATIEQDAALNPRVAGRAEKILGFTYWKLGLLEPAERHAIRATTITERAFGADDPDTLDAKHSLALVYTAQGRIAEAEQLNGNILEIRRRVLGRDHARTLVSMNNLADVLIGRGEGADAEELLKEALEIERRVLGQRHGTTLLSQCNLARAYNLQGRFVDAERLLRDTIEDQRRVLGLDHWQTSYSMYHLADAYFRQGRYSDAEALHAETLEIRRRALGRYHRYTINSLTGLALVYIRQGRLVQAEKLLTEAIDAQHVGRAQVEAEILLALYDLGCASALQGDRTKALYWLTKAVEHGSTDAQRMAQDEDLKSLRGDPAFVALVARAQGNAANVR